MKKILALCALAAFAAGCTTHVRIRTEPEGGVIRYRGEGRANFRWKYAYPTRTKSEFDTYYGRITTYATWPDGAESEKVTVPLSSFRDPPEIVLSKPGHRPPPPKR